MTSVTRRGFFGYGFGAAALATTLPSSFSTRAFAAPTSLGPGDVKDFLTSIANAIAFQNRMMDAYATGNTVRLVQSYADSSGLQSTAFTYDNALAIHAYLLEGTSDALHRAKVLGQGLIYAQANNFPFNDGRFAQAYFVNTASNTGAYITPAAFPFYFYTSAVGDQAWAGMALAQLYARTHDPSFLTAALSVANWIVTNTYNTVGPGGFSFGTNINQFNQSVPSPNGKSTEHNIDTFAFFTMLDLLTHHGSATNGMTWKSLATHARSFVQAMYNPSGGFFWTGTLGDQASINYYPVPEDCQTWSFMAMLDNTYSHTIDWTLANLQATDTASSPNTSLTGSESFTGIVFDTASLNTTSFDPNAVWLEGSAHTIAALITRALAGQGTFHNRMQDLQAAAKLVDMCESAQVQLGAGQTVAGKAIPLGQGLVAATSVMDTGFGYTYGPSKHIGATAWYLIAAYAGNPLRLGYRP